MTRKRRRFRWVIAGTGLVTLLLMAGPLVPPSWAQQPGGSDGQSSLQALRSALQPTTSASAEPLSGTSLTQLGQLLQATVKLPPARRTDVDADLVEHEVPAVAGFRTVALLSVPKSPGARLLTLTAPAKSTLAAASLGAAGPPLCTLLTSQGEVTAYQVQTGPLTGTYVIAALLEFSVLTSPYLRAHPYDEPIYGCLLSRTATRPTTRRRG
jgi:hypothetical protein